VKEEAQKRAIKKSPLPETKRVLPDSRNPIKQKIPPENDAQEDKAKDSGFRERLEQKTVSIPCEVVPIRLKVGVVVSEIAKSNSEKWEPFKHFKGNPPESEPALQRVIKKIENGTNPYREGGIKGRKTKRNQGKNHDEQEKRHGDFVPHKRVTDRS